MGDLLISLLAFIVAISVLVAVHEYGHYIVGRWTGMKVLRFSIGFGKPIVSWVRGKDRTEYCLSAIPLGGYVRFLDGREGPVSPEDQGRAFDHRPVAARIAVLLAGPAFNFLFAILAYWVIFASGVPTLLPAVGEVAPGSHAARAGLQTGDRILAVGNANTGDWETALVGMLDQMISGGDITLTLRNDAGVQRSATLVVGSDAARLTEPGMLFDGLGFVPWQPPAVIANVTPGGAASEVDLVAGDRVIAVAGSPVRTADDLIREVSSRPGETVALQYYRDQELRDVDITIRAETTQQGVIGRIGVAVSSDYGDLAYLRKFGPLAAVSESVEKTWATMTFTVRMLGRMVTGDVSLRNISGPIKIAEYAGDSAARGSREFLTFLALVSISLGILNLLPVPVLDGGQIVFQTVELLKGSPVSERSQILGQQFGIVALILLMSFAFYNDLTG
ncbi:MAG: RIP metalloprotease RseP [Gammaproteobacteria bacterium]|nr:RIP metalloprotease RseP [Gammaproteobacteria bacterium]MDH5303338.1 RIP metalloprotease RseP [Gammaproteobacteria bacterium]MDH5322468.1 RIP metalloprotease RseP [Gammaproteobacteria bacterium]